jgi:hypothetical protein
MMTVDDEIKLLKKVRRSLEAKGGAIHRIKMEVEGEAAKTEIGIIESVAIHGVENIRKTIELLVSVL